MEDTNARKLSTGTQKGHLRACRRFAAFLKRSPDTASCEDIRRFQLHLAQSDVSISNRNRTMTGLRFLFRVTLRRLDLAADIYHIREPQKIPLEARTRPSASWPWPRASGSASCSALPMAAACAPATSPGHASCLPCLRLWSTMTKPSTRPASHRATHIRAPLAAAAW